eukprot:5609277-Pyramimonas_sp.AAC.1
MVPCIQMLCETCRNDPALFNAFLNRVFNTVNWTITEFSVAMKEIQQEAQVYSLSPRMIGPHGGYMPSPLTGLVRRSSRRPRYIPFPLARLVRTVGICPLLSPDWSVGPAGGHRAEASGGPAAADAQVHHHVRAQRQPA